MRIIQYIKLLSAGSQPDAAPTALSSNDRIPAAQAGDIGSIPIGATLLSKLTNKDFK